MATLKGLPALLLGLLGVVAIAPAQAANYWVNWNGAPPSYPNTLPGGSGYFYATSASGTLYDPETSSTIGVTYSGEVLNLSQFNNSSGIDLFNYPAFQAANVTTLPPRGNFIALSGFSGLTNTLTFSKPVRNLLMALSSLGSPGIPSTYLFSGQSPVVSSKGQGKYGDGPFYMQTPTTVYGAEGNGMLQFNGTFSSLSWTVPSPELDSAFNVGIADSPAPVPAPLPALGAVAAYRLSRRLRRRLRQATLR